MIEWLKHRGVVWKNPGHQHTIPTGKSGARHPASGWRIGPCQCRRECATGSDYHWRHAAVLNLNFEGPPGRAQMPGSLRPRLSESPGGARHRYSCGASHGTLSGAQAHWAAGSFSESGCTDSEEARKKPVIPKSTQMSGSFSFFDILRTTNGPRPLANQMVHSSPLRPALSTKLPLRLRK